MAGAAVGGASISTPASLCLPLWTDLHPPSGNLQRTLTTPSGRQIWSKGERQGCQLCQGEG